MRPYRLFELGGNLWISTPSVMGEVLRSTPTPHHNRVLHHAQKDEVKSLQGGLGAVFIWDLEDYLSRI